MVTPGWMSGLPALPMAAMRPFFRPDVGFHHAPVVEDQRVGDDRIDRAALVGDLALSHAVADHLAAAELHFLAIGREVFFHLDDDVGIGQANPVARCGAEHARISVALDSRAHVRTFPSRLCETRRSRAFPRPRTSVTSRPCPGSKRTAVPGRISSRCLSPSPGRIQRLDWFRRNGNASPPEWAGRRYSRHFDGCARPCTPH